MKKPLLIISSMLLLSFLSYSQSIESIVAEHERAKNMTLAYIDAMPEDKFDFRPAEGVRSYSEQMLHTAQGLIGLSGNATGAERIFANENLEKTESYQSKSEVRRIVAEAFDFAIASIREMDPDSFDEVIERGPFKVTRAGWLNKSFEHLTHHRGQCAVYLRMAGITPPQYQLF